MTKLTPDDFMFIATSIFLLEIFVYGIIEYFAGCRDGEDILNKYQQNLCEDCYLSFDDDCQEKTMKKTKMSIIDSILSGLPKIVSHKHDSIPSLTSEAKNGCSICIRNQALQDVKKYLEGLREKK